MKKCYSYACLSCNEIEKSNALLAIGTGDDEGLGSSGPGLGVVLIGWNDAENMKA